MVFIHMQCTDANIDEIFSSFLFAVFPCLSHLLLFILLRYVSIHFSRCSVQNCLVS